MTGICTLSSNEPDAPGPRDGGVVADDPRAHHEHGLGDDRVDLAGHDRRAGLEVGDVQLAEAGVRAGAHPAEVVADLREAHGDGAQRSGCLDEAVAVGLRLEVVGGLGDRQLGLGCEELDDELREAGRGVDAGADGRAAERHLGDAGERRAARARCRGASGGRSRRTPGRG